MTWNRVAPIVLAITLFSLPTAAAPKRAQSFVESIGVNVHLMYFDGGYSNLDRTLAALSYLGIHNVRDSALSAAPSAWARYAAAAEAGVKFNLFVRDDDVTGALARLHTFVQQFPGSIISIEGPNEVNNFPVVYRGKAGTEGAQIYQKSLFDTVKSDPLLKDIPVYNFTTYPNASGASDFGNIHPYPKGGRQPYDTILSESQNRIMPDKPLVITEAGYYTLPGPAGWGGVDDQTQGVYLVNLLLDAAFLGLPRTYIYQLLDAYPDADMTKQESHFGLFDIRYQPKSSATAIRNIVRLMTDNDPGANAFPLRATDNYTINAPSSARSLIFQKAARESIVAVWNEPQIWDGQNFRPIAPVQETVTLTLSDGPQNISLIDPLKGLSPQKRLQRVSEVKFSLGSSPIFVVLTR